MNQLQTSQDKSSRSKLVAWIVIPIVLAGLLVFAFFQGREEMKREREREATIQAPSKIRKNKTGQTVLTLEPKTLEVSGIQIQIFQSHGGLVQLPESAVIRENEKTWVYVEISSHEFSRAEIRSAQAEDGHAHWRVLAPITPQLKIVTTGAQSLLSEELKSQIQMGESGGR